MSWYSNKTAGVKRQRDLFEELASSARQVPSFYSSIDDENGYLERYKKANPKPIPEPFPLSESPFLLNTERFDMSTPEDPERLRKDLTAKILGVGPSMAEVQIGRQALEVAESMDITLPLSTYHHLLGILLHCNKFQSVISWYDELKEQKKPVVRSATMLHSLLCACIYSKHVPRSVGTVRALLDVNKNSDMCTVFPDPKNIPSHYYLPSKGPLATLFTEMPNSLLKMLLENRHYAVAIRVLQYLKSHNKTIPIDIINDLLKDLIEGSIVEKALSAYDLIKDTSVEIPPPLFNRLAVICSLNSKENEIVRFQEILTDMKEKKVPFTLETFQEMMKTANQNEKIIELTVEMFPQLLSSGAIDGNVFGQYITLVTKTKSVPLSTSMTLYRNRRNEFGLQNTNNDLYITIMEALCENHELIQALEVLEDMNEIGCPMRDCLSRLYHYCSSGNSIEHLHELSLLPSKEDSTQTELDRLLHKALYIDVPAFRTLVQCFGISNTSLEQTLVSSFCSDNRDYFGQRPDEFTTLFSETAVKRMSKGRSYVLVIDSSSLLTLSDDNTRQALELLMNEGQESSQQKSIILVSFPTQVELMKLAYSDSQDSSKSKAVLKTLGEFYQKTRDWLKFSNFSNFLECVLRITDNQGDINEGQILLTWMDGFSQYYKQTILITEKEDIQLEAVTKNIVATSIRTLLTFSESK